jgi:voltage-gated potassium channel
VSGVYERQMARFLKKPVTVRSAVSVIVSATIVIVVGSGILMRLLDQSEYPNVFKGMWWAIQTVTTVGYGDVTPKAVSGRVVAVFVMLEGVAFLAVATAAITSTFIARASRERGVVEAADGAQLEAVIRASLADVTERLDRIEPSLAGMTERLDRIEPMLGTLTDRGAARNTPD